MSDLTDYYNSFYKDLAVLDRQGNSFKKIEKIISPIVPDMKVLDVGCGYGSVSAELIRMGCKVYGMEVNKDAIEELKRQDFVVIEYDITKPFILKEKFKLILLLDILEHVFSPVSVLQECQKILDENGEMIISVPLYFDLRDRFRILFTGNIISYDNLCYGKENYKKFRSFNYDHIRFFRPKDLKEMCEIAGLSIIKINYSALGGIGRSIFGLFMNKYTVNILPNLFAHAMILKVKKTSLR